MRPAAGPCSVKHWECKEDFLPCYRDCCTRGVAFCNHLAQRCQKCSTVDGLCSNQTALPWECDIYCFRKSMPGSVPVEASDLVNPGYKYAAYVLGLLVLLLIIKQAVDFYRMGSCRIKEKSSLKPGKKVSPTASSDKSTASGDDAKSDSPLINMSSEFNGQQGVSEPTITLPNLHQSQVNTPVPTSERQDSLQPLGQSPVSHTCSTPGSAIPTPDGNPSTLASQVSQPSSATHRLHQGACRDPRLDNITPSSDSENGTIPVHTGMSPRSLNYSVS